MVFGVDSFICLDCLVCVIPAFFRHSRENGNPNLRHCEPLAARQSRKIFTTFFLSLNLEL
jgi:hypothetical protein